MERFCKVLCDFKPLNFFNGQFNVKNRQLFPSVWCLQQSSYGGTISAANGQMVCSINWKKAEIITFDEEVLHFKLVTLSMVARHRLGWGYWHELGGNKSCL